jgi:hypothetical protein
MVADVELVKEKVTLPSLTLQGVDDVHVAPIARVVGALNAAARSESWLAFCTPDPPPL